MLDRVIGKEIVEIAREAIEHYLATGQKLRIREGKIREKLRYNYGVFVTLRKYKTGELRGCIGFPEPCFSLSKALVEAAISAAIEDPRFLPVTLDEMNDIIVEVSILTPLTRLKGKRREEILKEIEIGRDGLVIRKGYNSGLLLPQVPLEEGWSKKDFISYTCLKAGLPPNCWLDEETEIYKFHAQIFKEEKPRGEVKERILGR